MVKLIDLLKGTIRNPLSGELYEGLTKTIESSIAVKILTNKLRDVPGFDIEDNEDNITLNFEPQYVPDNLGNYTSGNFHDKNIDKIFELTNNLGYFPAGFSSVSNTNVISNYNRYTASSFKKLLETQPTTIELIFEKKYDDEEKSNPIEVICEHPYNLGIYGINQTLFKFYPIMEKDKLIPTWTCTDINYDGDTEMFKYDKINNKYKLKLTLSII